MWRHPAIQEVRAIGEQRVGQQQLDIGQCCSAQRCCVTLLLTQLGQDIFEPRQMVILWLQPLVFGLTQRGEEALDLRQQAGIITPGWPEETTRIKLQHQVPRAHAVSSHAEDGRRAGYEQAFPQLFAHL